MKLNLKEAAFCKIPKDKVLAYIEYRKAMRKPLTQRALNKAIRNAYECEKLGITATEAFDMTISKCRAGVSVELIMIELKNRNGEDGETRSQ